MARVSLEGKSVNHGTAHLPRFLHTIRRKDCVFCAVKCIADIIGHAAVDGNIVDKAGDALDHAHRIECKTGICYFFKFT